MTAIALKFPAGRFHSTPWGRHVNEGAPEWPPSPWRLLRSLVAVWKIKAPEIGESQVRELLQRLSAPPRFFLPRATVGHTRHYMRWFKKGPEDQTLVFDTFVCVGRDGEVIAVWPGVELSPEQRRLLENLLDKLAYVGRAESWCIGRLLSPEDAAAVDVNCFPVNGSAAGAKGELVQVLCADPETAFSDEHVKPLGGKKRRSSRPVYDPAWNLCIETAQLHAEKWSDPPGSRWVMYVRPADCFHPEPSKPRRKPAPQRHIQVARYVLDSQVLPLVTETLTIAEEVRSELLRRYGRETRWNGVNGRSETFSGKDAKGNPLTGHGHAYYLATDEDGDGRIDHVTVVAENGFTREEVRALDRLHKLRRGEENPELLFLLVGLGRIEELRVPVLEKSKRWVSATPFLATRHPKKNGRKRDPVELLQDRQAFVEQVLREELERFCERRGLPWKQPDFRISRIEDPPGAFRIDPRRWEPQATGPGLRPLQFKRFRSRKRDDDGGRRPSGSFLIEFPEPVRGPICLGHSAHFGLGLFLPAVKQS